MGQSGSDSLDRSYANRGFHPMSSAQPFTRDTLPVVEVVPNFSEGRDPSFLPKVVGAFETAGAEVLDSSMDPDHHRSVVTAIGSPEAIRAGMLLAAGVAFSAIDMREHQGVHPRVGALDVLPVVPIQGVTWDEAVRLAQELGAAIEGAGVGVRYYGRASSPPGAVLADLRRGGYEGLDEPRTKAGVTCVGVRDILLAWNVDVVGIDLAAAREIASTIRARNGGFAGLRALGLALPQQNRVQISMNLEDPNRTSPLEVFSTIEEEVLRRSGEVVDTEIIGMVPDALANPDAETRIRLRDSGPHRYLGQRVAEHVTSRLAETR